MDSESKDTADRHKVQDRRPDGPADWRGKYREDVKRGQKKMVFITVSKEGGSGKGRVENRKGEVFAGVRCHGERVT